MCIRDSVKADGTAVTTALEGTATVSTGLIAKKSQYIAFINGKDAAKGGLDEIKIDDGSTSGKTTNPWNTPTEKRSGVANYGEDASAKVDVYSKESAEALKALVADTEKSILATKDVTELKQVYTDAYAKYDAIATTEQLQKKWEKGEMCIRDRHTAGTLQILPVAKQTKPMRMNAIAGSHSALIYGPATSIR